MDYAFLIVSSGLVLICFYFIISPFFVSKGERDGIKKEREKPLTLDDIYTVVNELEMEYLMKKMTEEDFYRQKEQYQLLAKEIFDKEKITEEKNPDGFIDKEVEQEILNQLQKIRAEKGE